MLKRIKDIYRRNITARLRWLAMKVPRPVWFFMSMLALAFVPMLLIFKLQILGYDIKAFCKFVESDYTEYQYLGLASFLLLWGSLVGYFANARWLFYLKAAQGTF